MSSGELFKMMAGVNMLHVPYRGAGQRAGSRGDQVQVSRQYGSSIEYIRTGKLRGVGGDAATRSEVRTGHCDRSPVCPRL